MTPDLTKTSSQKTHSQLTIRSRAGQEVHLNGRVIRGYDHIWTTGEPLKKSNTRRRMIALVGEGLDAHRNKYHSDPERVTTCYFGNQEYEVLSINGSDTNGFKRTF